MLGIATNPVYISQITRIPAYWHTGTGNRKFTATMGRNLGDLVPAPLYPRIIDDETFHRAAANLQDKPRRAFNPHVEVERGAARHLLTHIAVCGECGGNITPGNRVYKSAAAPAVRPGANTAKGKKGFQKLPEGTIRESKVTRYYRCGRKLDVNVPEAAADEYVSVLVVDKLAELAASRWSVEHDSEDLCRACADLEDREAQLEDAIARLRAQRQKGKDGSRALIELYAEEVTEHEAAIGWLKSEKDRLALPETLRPFADCGDDRELIAKAWHDLTLDGKRSVLRVLAESITLRPAKHSGRGQGPVGERIEVTWNPVYVVSSDQAAAADRGNVTPSA